MAALATIVGHLCKGGDGVSWAGLATAPLLFVALSSDLGLPPHTLHSPWWCWWSLHSTLQQLILLPHLLHLPQLLLRIQQSLHHLLLFHIQQLHSSSSSSSTLHRFTSTDTFLLLLPVQQLHSSSSSPFNSYTPPPPPRSTVPLIHLLLIPGLPSHLMFSTRGR